MINAEIEPNLNEFRKSEMEDIHFAQWVDKINTHNHINRRLLVISDSSFAFWKTKGFSKVFEKTKSYSWFALTSIEIEKNTFKLCFFKDIATFTYDQPDNLFTALGNLLVNIYIPSEYPEIHGKTTFSLNNYVIDATKSGLMRLKAHIFEKNEETDEINRLFDTFNNFLLSGMTTFNLGLFENFHYIEYLLDSLSVIPHVTSVVFPFSKKSNPHWIEFRSLLQNAQYVESVTTFEEITDEFEVLSSLNRSHFSPTIKTLGFGNSDLSEKEMGIISQIYKNCDIPNIKFIGTKYAMVAFRKNLLNFTNNSNFKSVTLDKIMTISLYTTIKLLKNVERLGITSCGIEISEAIQTICGLNGLMNIKSFDFSGNLSMYLLPETNLYLPSNLEELKLNNIKFNGNSLQVLLAFLAAQHVKDNFSIQINNIDLDQQKWDSLINFTEIFSKANSNITIPKEESPKSFPFRAIQWDNNKISGSILKYFERSSELRFLSIEGCDMSIDPKFIQYLRSFIQNTKTCVELNISGGRRHSLKQADLESIISEFKRDKRSIKRIHLSRHYYAPNTLDVLADTLMMNRVIEYVDFTTNYIMDKNVWKRFFQKLLSRGTPLSFPIPQYEFGEMLLTQTITTNELHDILMMIKAIHKGNKDVIIPLETIQPTVDDNEEDDNNNYAEDENEVGNNEFGSNSLFSLAPPVRMIDNTKYNAMFKENFALDRLLDQI